jgi:hypothetical protein
VRVTENAEIRGIAPAGSGWQVATGAGDVPSDVLVITACLGTSEVLGLLPGCSVRGAARGTSSRPGWTGCWPSRGTRTMLPLVARIRAAVDCYVAAQPVPYRTDAASPTMQSLREQLDRVFPVALEPLGCSRFEMASFASAARDLGVNYLGICCGGAPHLVRAMAEALGRVVPASKYLPALELHPMFRDAISAEDSAFLGAWNA